MMRTCVRREGRWRCLSKNQAFTGLFYVGIILVVIVVSIIKFRGGEINYLDSDATWHTLLTMQAYDETPISQHKFLPIVSLGGVDNKGISWGATIPDKEGNFYYTSFSPAGFVLPYLFIKVFRLPINETSLYYFNTLLFAISAVLWAFFLKTIYTSEKWRWHIICIGVLTYIFSPELFHGMGIVYWHQSIMQVMLIAQFLTYYQYKTKNSKKGKIAFYLITLIIPYIEWTGYVANLGFALFELGSDWKFDLKRAWKNAIVIGAITVASFGLFTVHYLSVVAASDFFLALKNRFFARNIASSTLLTDVFGSYLKSFLLLWILLFFLIIWNIIKNEKIELKNKCILFVLAFPLLENVVMKEHALSYSYDRMKMVFILSYLICELVAQILVSYEKRNKAAFIIIAIVTVICCFGNLNYYRKDSKYIWDVTYRKTNKKISEYINQNYWNSVLITNASVRGYLNLLFNRGIYEWGDIDSVRDIALQKGKRYAIELKTLDAPGNMYQLTGAIVYDVAVDKFIYIKLRNDGTIVELNNDVEEYNLADLTDENWTSGYSNVGNVLLFYYEEELLNNLRNGTFVSTGERQFTIQDIKYDSQWIKVTVEGDASSCKYPAYISIQ